MLDAFGAKWYFQIMEGTTMEIRKAVRRAPWRNSVNRRGGKYTVWCVYEQRRLVAEFFTQRDAERFVKQNEEK